MRNSTLTMLGMHKHRNGTLKVDTTFMPLHTAREPGTEFCRVVTFSSAYQTCASESRSRMLVDRLPNRDEAHV